MPLSNQELHFSLTEGPIVKVSTDYGLLENKQTKIKSLERNIFLVVNRLQKALFSMLLLPCSHNALIFLFNLYVTFDIKTNLISKIIIKPVIGRG